MYKFADMILVTRFEEALWLFHINVFFCEAVQERSNKVNSPEPQVMFGSDGHGHSDRFKPGDSCPHFIVIDPKLLSIPLSNYPGLILHCKTHGAWKSYPSLAIYMIYLCTPEVGKSFPSHPFMRDILYPCGWKIIHLCEIYCTLRVWISISFILQT